MSGEINGERGFPTDGEGPDGGYCVVGDGVLGFSIGDNVETTGDNA